MKMVLNAGSGRQKKEGFVNLDIRSNIDVDVVHDLNVAPYPFEDNYFDEVILSHIVEHLYDCFKCFDEIHRICKDGAVVKVIVPHYTDWTYWRHPDHRLHFSSYSFEFLERTKSHHFDTENPYKIIDLKVYTQKLWRYLGIQTLINYSINHRKFRFIRKFWEAYLSFFIRASTVEATLKVIKNQKCNFAV